MIIIFGYLTHHIRIQIVCDTIFLECHIYFDLEINCQEVYPDDVEDLAHQLPEKKVNTVKITTIVDSDRAPDLKIGVKLLEY